MRPSFVNVTMSSRPLTTNARANAPNARRIPAGDIEGLVNRRILRFFADRAQLFEATGPWVPDIAEQEKLLGYADGFAERWNGLAPPELRSAIRSSPFASLGLRRNEFVNHH